MENMKAHVKNFNNSQNETSAENGQKEIKCLWEHQCQESHHHHCCDEGHHYHIPVLSGQYPSPWIQLKVSRHEKSGEHKKTIKETGDKPDRNILNQ